MSNRVWFSSAGLPWLLIALLGLTRFTHIGDPLHLPDASTAVFFFAGFLLTRRWFWVLIAEAALIDSAVFALNGYAGHCFTPSYGFLLVAYAVLWWGGQCRHRIAGHSSVLAKAAACWWVAASLAFSVSNGAYYWLSGNYPTPTLGEYAARFLEYYPLYLLAPWPYLLVAAGVLVWRRRSGQSPLAS